MQLLLTGSGENPGKNSAYIHKYPLFIPPLPLSIYFIIKIGGLDKIKKLCIISYWYTIYKGVWYFSL